MSALARPPGTPRVSVRPESSGVPGWDYFAPHEHEYVPEWRWPQLIDSVEQMVSEPQVAAVESAVTLPTLRYRRALDPNGMDPADAALLADDLDLPLVGSDVAQGRSPRRFNARRHMTRALLMTRYGVQIFQIGGWYPDGPRMWRFQRARPVPLRAITRWEVDDDGALEAIWIWSARRMRDVKLPAEHLLVYTWQGEAGDPLGRSMLRPLWRPYSAKDRTMRLDVLKHERNSMGIPWGALPEGASQRDVDLYEQLLASIAAGEGANVTLPFGGKFGLAGVQGQTSDTVGSMRFFNEEMARATATMVLQAGQTGSGTLTSAATHEDLLRQAQDVIVQQVCDVQTEQLCARWVEWNPGPPDAPVGRVVWEREQHEAEPEPSGAAERPAPVAAAGRRGRPTPSAPTRERARRPVAAAADVPLPDRRLRRQPTAVEAAAGMDAQRIEQDWTDVQQQIAGLLAGVRDDLAAVALDAIRDIDRVEPLTLAETLGPILAAAADEQDTGPLSDALQEAAERGARQVVEEATRQGRTIDAPDVDYGERAQLEATAAVQRTARSLTETAAAAAQVGAQPGTAGTEVAGLVEDAVDRLTDAQPERAASGMTSRAQLTGRDDALAAGPYQRIYPSALLDSNTCGPCADWDGHEFATLEEFREQFPSGGNKDCSGGDSCRCVGVGVLADEQETAT